MKVKLVQKGFFKVPKKLLTDETFKTLNLSSRLIIFYLLSLTNSFQTMIFWQKPLMFTQNIGLSRMTVSRAKKDLEKMDIRIRVENKKWSINMVFFCGKFMDFEENHIKKLRKDHNNLVTSIVE